MKTQFDLSCWPLSDTRRPSTTCTNISTTTVPPTTPGPAGPVSSTGTRCLSSSASRSTQHWDSRRRRRHSPENSWPTGQTLPKQGAVWKSTHACHGQAGAAAAFKVRMKKYVFDAFFCLPLMITGTPTVTPTGVGPRPRTGLSTPPWKRSISDSPSRTRRSGTVSAQESALSGRPTSPVY